MTHPPIKAPFELPQTEAAAVQAALRGLIDGIHAGRFVPVSDGSKGFCASLVDAGESAIAATQPSAAPGDGQAQDKGMTAAALKRLIGSAVNYPATARSKNWVSEVFGMIDALAAPSAAIAAREQEMPTALSKKDVNKLLNDFARACAFGDDVLARMAASNAIHEYLDAAFAALAAPGTTSDWLSNRAQLHEWLADGATLHPHTLALVVQFARALAEKLAAAEKKYGYSDGWLQTDWMDECRAKLQEHIAKGDPRDVAAYCAFLWHHGESTASPAAAPTSQPNAAAQEQQAGWRDISTAPKDGTMFLCWVGAERWSAMDGGGSGCAHDVSQIDFCWWRRVHESPDGGYFDNASGQFGDSQGVTHWMPFPPAPTGMESVRSPSVGKEQARATSASNGR